MPNNRIRCLIISIGIILLISFIIGSIIYIVRRRSTRLIDQRIIPTDSCPRPKSYLSNYDFDYTKHWKEYRNTDAPIDYFRFSLSWSPTFCEGKHNDKLFQCEHPFGFIVHGLWPSRKTILNNSQQHQRNCRNEQEIPIEIIEKYFCLMPSEHLMQNEWEKHGTCYWKKPEDYFSQIENLYSKIKLPNDFTNIFNNQTITKRLRRDAIKQSILNLNPQLNAKHIDVQMTNQGKKLKEVAFCYDHQFNHINCY